MRYMLPLAAVYLFEYLINQGLVDMPMLAFSHESNLDRTDFLRLFAWPLPSPVESVSVVPSDVPAGRAYLKVVTKHRDFVDDSFIPAAGAAGRA